MSPVTTLREPQSAEIAREALDERGILTEVRRSATNPYFGSATRDEWEVRVPASRLADAEAVLDLLAIENDRAVRAQAEGADVATGTEADPHKDESEADWEEPAAVGEGRFTGPRSRKRVSWAEVVTTLVALAPARGATPAVPGPGQP